MKCQSQELITGTTYKAHVGQQVIIENIYCPLCSDFEQRITIIPVALPEMDLEDFGARYIAPAIRDAVAEAYADCHPVEPLSDPIS